MATLLIAAGGLSAEPHGDEHEPLRNLEGPTFGGTQLWTDELVCHDWRIQRHAWTGHYRLLDEQNRRRAWGDFAACRDAFARLRMELDLPPMQGRVVMLLHGLVRSRKSMEGLGSYLREESDFTVINVSYASTRHELDQHAAALARVIENLDPRVTEINFVAHSLGNLVIRRYLADQTNAGQGRSPDPRIKRIVMLAPPNNGARLAERFRHNQIFKAIWGKSGVELASSWVELEQQLATPACEFGIIAGGRGEPTGNNPLLPGDDDFVVSVEETRLPGASDFSLVPAAHALIMDQPLVQERVLRFLREGYFISEEQRQPILPEDEADE